MGLGLYTCTGVLYWGFCLYIGLGLYTCSPEFYIEVSVYRPGVIYL